MLKRYLFILGRDSELSKLELFALLNRLNIKFSINQNSKEFVVCKECGKPDTELIKQGRITLIKCLACGAKHPLRSKI